MAYYEIAAIFDLLATWLNVEHSLTSSFLLSYRDGDVLLPFNVRSSAIFESSGAGKITTSEAAPQGTRNQAFAATVLRSHFNSKLLSTPPKGKGLFLCL